MGNTNSSSTKYDPSHTGSSSHKGCLGISRSAKSIPVIENLPEGSSSVAEVDDKSENFDGLKCITVLIIGLGQRGQVYATYAKDFPERMKVLGIAEPIQRRRDLIKNVYKVDPEYVFTDWKEAAEKEKFADAVVITTLDHLHKEPCKAFAAKGYHVLLEKPMAPTLEDCEEIVKTCKDNGIILAVGHVLRYKPQFLKVKEIIDNGIIGDVINIQHMEPIGWNHYAHSYVRGNWRNEKESGFCLLTKSCHDIDLIHSFMKGSKCLSISSFGSLSHFRKEKKPEGAGSRCTDCSIQENCPYSAIKEYLTFPPHGFVYAVCDEPTPENILDALSHGPYGRCVYESDNDVVDNQVVNMYYEGGKTVSFSMIAFTQLMCQRQIKIFGTMGEIVCNEGEKIIVFDFNTEMRTVYEKEGPQELTTMRGHGFADYYLMRKFVKAVALGDPTQILSGPDDTLESHRLVFLAEKARKENKVIQVNEMSDEN